MSVSGGLKVLCTIFLLCFTHSLCAKTYYFSSSAGDDTRTPTQAQDQYTPWKTIARLNNFNGLQPGDSVLFQRGESFFGTIKANASGLAVKPLVYSAYGSGSQPVITSLITMKNWKSIGNGVYESYDDFFGQNLNIVLIKGIVHEMGRYPNRSEENSGYLKLDSHTGNTAISDNELSSTQNWTGAELVIRKNHWIIDRHKITAHSGTQINYEKGNSSYDPTDQFGYFIQNHIKTLDQFGEWYYNPATKKLSVYFGNENPQAIKVEAACMDNLLQSPQKSSVNMHLVFDQLHFKGANKSSVQLNSGNYFTIQNCSIEFSGESGIQADGVEHLTISKCAISKSNNNGIVSIYNNPYSVIQSNKIDSTYMFPGMGQSGDGNGIGLYCIGKNSTIEKNTITNTGYTALYFGGDSVQIKNNFIDRFCAVKDDGSGIYTFTGSENKNYFGRKITGNIVLNGIGAGSGTDSGDSHAEGIYLDDNVSGVSVSGNTVANITNDGIYLHNSRNITLNNNTVFNTGTQISLRHDLWGGDPIRNIKMYNNVLFSKYANQKLLSISTAKNDVAEMANLDSNFYDRPVYNSGAFISTQYRSLSNAELSTDFELEKWKTESKQDIASQKSLSVIPEYKVEEVSENNKIANSDFEKSIDGVGSYSPTNKIKLSRAENAALEVISSGLAYTIMHVGSVNTSKPYILRLDEVASKASTINVYLRQDQAPYKILSDVKSFTTTASIKTVEMLFQAKTEENVCVLIIESKDADLVYRLDNVKFTEARVRITNPDDYVRFEYNPTASVRTIGLDKVYINSRNQIVKDQVILQPFSSEILIVQKNIIVPTSPVVTSDDEKNTITVSHSFGQSEILVSENNGTYQQYAGPLSVGNVDRPAGYWKFKIKEAVDRVESIPVNSDRFTEDRGSDTDDNNPQQAPMLKLYPNPVVNYAKVFFTNAEMGQGSLSIYNFSGYKMMQVPINKNAWSYSDTVNFSYLKPGLYMVVIRLNGKNYVQKLIKF